MGRRPKVVTEVAATPVTPATPVVRRQRRTTRVDHGAQTRILVDALLRGRGVRGASQEEALAVVQWARGVHAEAEELKALTVRVRRAKTENAAERQVSLILNHALLNGVLAGSLIVDVNDVKRRVDLSHSAP